MVSSTEHLGPTRRKAVGAIGIGALAGLSGCLGAVGLDGEDAPEPVGLSGGKLDYHGGMEIGLHGGPNGQVFYSDNEPEPMHDGSRSPDARDDLAWFHTLVHGLFPEARARAGCRRSLRHGLLGDRVGIVRARRQQGDASADEPRKLRDRSRAHLRRRQRRDGWYGPGTDI